MSAKDWKIGRDGTIFDPSADPSCTECNGYGVIEIEGLGGPLGYNECGCCRPDKTTENSELNFRDLFAPVCDIQEWVKFERRRKLAQQRKIANKTT
jgi:hypothetical protein